MFKGVISKYNLQQIKNIYKTKNKNKKFPNIKYLFNKRSKTIKKQNKTNKR
jgi:hypothetical protein